MLSTDRAPDLRTRRDCHATQYLSLLPSIPLSFQALQIKEKTTTVPLSLSASSVSLSEEECKNSLGALSKLSRTPAHPAAALLPSPLGCGRSVLRVWSA